MIIFLGVLVGEVVDAMLPEGWVSTKRPTGSRPALVGRVREEEDEEDEDDDGEEEEEDECRLEANGL